MIFLFQGDSQTKHVIAQSSKNEHPKCSGECPVKLRQRIIHHGCVVVQLGREPYFRSSFQASSTPKGCALRVFTNVSQSSIIAYRTWYRIKAKMAIFGKQWPTTVSNCPIILPISFSQGCHDNLNARYRYGDIFTIIIFHLVRYVISKY